MKAHTRGTALDTLRQSGSLRVLFPRNSGPGLEVVTVNTAGGVTGGDVFSLGLYAGAGTRLVATTQAAERAYRSKTGERGRIDTRITVRSGARVHWLPQEMILFRSSALDRSLTVDLAGDASLLLCEPLIFGRRAMGEVLDEASLNDRIEICRDGRLAFLDALRLDGNVAARMAHPATCDGAVAIASVVYIAPNAQARIAPLRGLLPATGGASLLSDDLLCVRIIAQDSFALRASLIPILQHLSDAPLPRAWMI